LFQQGKKEGKKEGHHREIDSEPPVTPLVFVKKEGKGKREKARVLAVRGGQIMRINFG